MSMSQLRGMTSTRLKLCKACTCCHSFCEFICVSFLLHLEFNVSLVSALPTISGLPNLLDIVVSFFFDSSIIWRPSTQLPNKYMGAYPFLGMPWPQLNLFLVSFFFHVNYHVYLLLLGFIFLSSICLSFLPLACCVSVWLAPDVFFSFSFFLLLSLLFPHLCSYVSFCLPAFCSY